MNRVDHEAKKLKIAQRRLEEVRVLYRDACAERDAYLSGPVATINAGERARPAPATAERLARMQSAVDYAAALVEVFQGQVSTVQAALERAREGEEPTAERGSLSAARSTLALDSTWQAEEAAGAN